MSWGEDIFVGVTLGRVGYQLVESCNEQERTRLSNILAINTDPFHFFLSVICFSSGCSIFSVQETLPSGIRDTEPWDRRRTLNWS